MIPVHSSESNAEMHLIELVRSRSAMWDCRVPEFPKETTLERASQHQKLLPQDYDMTPGKILLLLY